MRQIFLDTETTGFEHKQGHRVIEFGAVEMMDRKLTGKNLHFYFKPDIEVDEGALRVHGLSNEFLADKPLFEEKAEEIIYYLQGAEVIIHNAAFDVPFMDAELNRIQPNPWGSVMDHVTVTDSLIMARKKHPGQRNSLDALCKRYAINNQHRVFHGALLDSEILAEVYLAMTGGQTDLVFHDDSASAVSEKNASENVLRSGGNLPVIMANPKALQYHNDYLKSMAKKSGNPSVWQQLENLE
jgi:DNA polymerase-3 subunit epsilon